MNKNYFSVAGALAVALVSSACAAPTQNAEAASASSSACASADWAPRAEWQPRAHASQDLEKTWRPGVRQVQNTESASEIAWRPGVRKAVEVADNCKSPQQATY